jgi:nitrate/nitrite-specific signal transduction histidine kinase
MRALRTRGRLRIRILAWSFVPTAVILFVVALVAVYAYGGVTEQQAIQRNQELARLSAANLASEINQFALDLEGLTRQSDVAGNQPAQQNMALAAASNKLSIFDAGTFILDSHGRFVAAWPARPDDVGEDWSSRAYFAQLLRSSRPVYSDIGFDGAQGARVVTVAVPITGPGGEFNGVLAGMFRMGATSVSALYGDIAKLRLGVSGDVYVVDGSGLVIQHPDAALIGTDLMSEQIVQDVVSGQTGAQRTRDLNQRDVVAAYAPVPGTNWGLIAIEDWSTVIRPFQGYRTFLLVLLVLGLVVPSLVVWFGVRRVTRPVQALTRAARKVAAGDFEHSVSITTHDELQELAEQFNMMSAQLRDSYAELDKRVAARTQELATLNAVAAVVSQSLDLERILDDALGEIMADLGFEAGVAFMLPEREGQGSEVRLIASRNLPADVLTSIRTRSPEYLERRLTALEGQPAPLLMDSISEELRGLLEPAGWRYMIQIPVNAKGTVFGALMLLTRREPDSSPEQLLSLAALGNQIGMAVDNARLYEHAEESAAAAERNRLARDLHDAVSQTLFSVSLIAEVLPRIYARDPVQGAQRLDELRQLTRGALAEMRTLLLELRPADLAEANLSDLLKQLGEAVTGRARIPVAVTTEDAGAPPTEVGIALYRIAQEALNNVAKHSGATTATVSLRPLGERGGGLLLTIEDDGTGFDSAAAGFGQLGLGIMRERAEAIGATLTIGSEPGQGTTVSATWSPGGTTQQAAEE